MLNKSYDNVLLGMNYVSLIYGVLKLQQNKSSLIINNDNVSLTSNWLLNIGEIEKRVLKNIGTKYKIVALSQLDDFIVQTNNLVYLNDICIEFSKSPYLNLKEMMRKFPKSFLETFANTFESFSENLFNEQFFAMINEISNQQNYRDIHSVFKMTSFPHITEILEKYLEFTQKEEEFSKQINHILQVMYQVSFSSEVASVDAQYLFLSLLCPRYIINDEKLKSELLFYYRKLGGDIKDTKINDWGLVNGQLDYIMLNSVDGVIELEKAYLFAPPFETFPFKAKNSGNIYHSIDFQCLIDNEFIDFYKNKRITFSKNDRMGSDFPFWEFIINDEHTIKGTYAYMDGQGVKPSFYFHQAVEDIYSSLKELLPGLVKVDWVTRVSLHAGEDIWLEQDSSHHPGAQAEKFQGEALYNKNTHKKVEDIYQLGPSISTRMGLYGHLLDIFSI